MRWFWTGNLKEALEAMKGHENTSMLERGTLWHEASEVENIKNLLPGDVVYRISTLEDNPDDKTMHFHWQLCDPLDGRPLMEAWPERRQFG